MDIKARAYVNKHSVEFRGQCARGVQSVQINAGSQVLGNTPCDKDGTYVWASQMVDNEYELSFSPVIKGGESSTTQAIAQTLIVDTIAPPTPVIRTNNGHNVVTINSQVSIDGSATGNVSSIIASGNGILSTSSDSTQFSYNLSLEEGETTTLSFFAVDFAGNRSDSVSIVVSRMGNLAMNGSEFVALSQNTNVESDTAETQMEVATIAPLSGSTNAGQGSLDTGAVSIWSETTTQ